MRRLMGRPKWRPNAALVRKAIDSLQHGHKALVGALEWLDRDDDGAFMDTALDQVHMAWRFLGEVLVRHGRIPKLEEYDDDD